MMIITSCLSSFILYAGEKITLDQAKQYAIDKNYHLKSLQKEKEALYFQSNLEASKFFPELSMVSAISRYGASAKETGSVAYADFKYNLFNGFRDQADFHLSRSDLEKADLLLKKEIFKIGLDVEAAFHTYIYFRDLIDLQKKSLTMNTEHQSLVNKTKKTGLINATDVMEFIIKDAMLRSDLELIMQNLEETRISLKSLLGDQVGSGITPVGSLQHQHIRGSLMSYIDRIKTSSFPVKIANIDLKQANIRIRRLRSSWLPSLNLEIQAGQITNETKDFNVNFLLSMNFALFSGFESRYERQKEYSRLERDENLLKESILQSVSGIERSFKRLRTIERRVDLEEHNTDRSKKYYTSVKNEYLRGYKNSSDLASAAERYTESRKRKIEFMYEFLMEKITLERSLGEEADVELIH
ncbi:MAG: TolC family protein [Deltaproteobacteria bacterium]|nr:TolC family protein [Deltaproteobacteria bacterium]